MHGNIALGAGQEWLDIVGGEWNLYFGKPSSATNKRMYKVMYPYSYGYTWEVRPVAARAVCVFVGRRASAAIGPPFTSRVLKLTTCP